MQCASRAARPRNRPRTSRYAASVPSPTARKLDSPATRREFVAAASHVSSMKNSRYQRSDSPGGGNRREAALEKDIGRTMATGNRRNVSAAPDIIASPMRSTRPTARSARPPARLAGRPDVDPLASPPPAWAGTAPAGSVAGMRPDHPAEKIERAHQDQEERRDRGCQLPPRERVDEHLQHVGDHRDASPAQHGGRDVEPE